MTQKGDASEWWGRGDDWQWRGSMPGQIIVHLRRSAYGLCVSVPLSISVRELRCLSGDASEWWGRGDDSEWRGDGSQGACAVCARAHCRPPPASPKSTLDPSLSTATPTRTTAPRATSARCPVQNSCQ
eukprot:3747133-Rhodomonas_salina.6